jgi:dynactin 1
VGQDADARIRAAEKKISELRQRIKELEPVREKAERYEGIIQKLQAKGQSQFQENNELKKQLKELESEFGQIEKIQAEHDSIMEMATLDREVAEEKAEAFKAELDAVKSRWEELELENEILKGENEELSKDMSPEERASQGWLQMQRENSRLREALLRLRDLSQEQEASLRDEIEILEEDSQELAKVKEQYDSTRTQLLETQAESEDLREQLDAALGAETMIEQLTEKNLSMSEQIDELRNAVDDLQSLKELNDELEINHIEHEKQLQEIIDFKDALLVEHTRRTVYQEEELTDRDYTISRFRELVTTLQSDLEDMRASKELTETEAQQLGSHSRAMMDLNRQLQASAMSTKVKTIDMELRKMEAQEASEHLTIVQLFLPEAFHAERDSILALLRFRRIDFKSRLLHGFMKEKLASPGPHMQTEQLLAACDALDKLTWISAMCNRFTNSISSSSLDQFANFESALYELEPVERTLNGYIDNLRKDELREQQVADGLQRSIAVMKHLSELHLQDSVENYAEEILMKTLLMQSNLETTATALMTTKMELLKVIPTSEDGDDEMSAFAERADAVAMQSRSAKIIVGKILRSLQELKTRSLALTVETQPNFEACQSATEELFRTVHNLGLSIVDAMHQEGRTSAFGLSDLLSAIREFNASHFHSTESDIFLPLQNKIKALQERLGDLYSVSSDLSLTIEFERAPAPWVLRSKELADSKIISADAQEEIASLKREIHERATAIKLRDQTLEEASVKIELLEARTRDSAKKANKISELEKLLDLAREQERKMEKKIEERTQLSARLEEERDRWMRKAAEMKMRDSTNMDLKRGGIDLVGTSAEMDALKQEIKVLESTVRFLRQQARRVQAEENARENSWLQQPLILSGRPIELVEQRAESIKALENLASLPMTAQPVILASAEEKKDRLKWRPMATTPQYQLCELEMQWLDTWEPIASKKNYWSGGVGPRVVAVS